MMAREVIGVVGAGKLGTTIARMNTVNAAYISVV